MLADLIAHLDTLDLPASVWRTGVRLAQRAADHPGVVLSYAELRAIVGTESDDTARAHLAKLHKVNVLWFRRDGDISITFYPMHVIAERSRRAPSDQNDRPAITVIAGRSDSETADYIITTTTNVVVDDDRDLSSSSSSSAAAQPDVQPQRPTAPQPPKAASPAPAPPPPAAAYADLVTLYEQNIGIITPILSGALRTALEIYPFAWIEQAIHLAVRNEVRRWNYIEAILANWQVEGFNGNGKRNNLAAAGGDTRRRAAPDRRTAQPAAQPAQPQQQWGPEWYFDPDDPPPVDVVA